MITQSDSSQFDEIWSLTKKKLQQDNDYPDTIMRLWFEELKLTILTDDTAAFGIRAAESRFAIDAADRAAAEAKKKAEEAKEAAAK